MEILWSHSGFPDVPGCGHSKLGWQEGPVAEPYLLPELGRHNEALTQDYYLPNAPPQQACLRPYH